MDLGLKGRTALVFGAGGGLGGAIADALAREGAAVAAADIDAAAAAATVARIAAAGGKAMPVAWDLADLGVIAPNLAAVEQQLGPVDVLVNNTGGPPPTPATGQPPADWEKHFHAMVVSVIAITDAVLPGMRARKWGRIVTSTSSGVVAPIANLAISNALRLSLVGWSKTLAREVGRDGVTANIILPASPPAIRFSTSRGQREGSAEVSAEHRPFGRYGEPANMATVAFLPARGRSGR